MNNAKSLLMDLQYMYAGMRGHKLKPSDNTKGRHRKINGNIELYLAKFSKIDQR